MSAVVLLHGGMHWGRCWDAVRPHLEEAGRTVLTPDLPMDDDSAGAADWAVVVMDSIDAAVDPDDRDVVVVAHSISGLCLPVIAERRAIRRMVFLSALLPVPGLRFADYLATQPGMLPFSEHVAAVGEDIGFAWDSVHRAFYHDCIDTVSRRAHAELRRQSITAFLEPCPLIAWPDTDATVIVMRDDRVVSPEWSRRVASTLPRADLVELDGGHSPFLADPAALGAVLLRL